MIEKILFIGDYYRGNQETNVEITYKLISPIMYHKNIIAETLKNTNQFENKKKWVQSLAGEGESFLEALDLSKTLIIGFEINYLDKLFLIENKIHWIDIEIHPIRFLEDLYLSISHSFNFNINKISIPDSNVQLNANFLTIPNINRKYDIKPNSLLILGQEPQDKSIFFNNTFKSLLSYKEKLDSLVLKYDNIYFRPHPFKSDKKVNEVILEEYNATLLSDLNYYDLLSCKDIVAVCGISSSTLHEAQYFNKEVIFLEENAKKFSKPISLESFLKSSQFWDNIIANGKQLSSMDNFIIPDNTCREFFSYWSYETKLTKLDSRVNITEAKANEAEAKANEAEAKASEAEAKASEAEAKASDAIHNYQLIMNSNSWKITKPLRVFVRGLKWFVRGSKAWITFSHGSRPRRVVKQILLALKHRINNSPKLKMKVMAFLSHFPKLKTKLKNLENHMPNRNGFTYEKIDLSPQAEEIYHKIKETIANKKANK